MPSWCRAAPGGIPDRIHAPIRKDLGLLLDTDVQDNVEELRGVTDRLYGGGGEHRLLQELLLGIGGALVGFVGGKPVNTTAYRLPEVAVGENQYIPLDPAYDDGSFLGFLRMIGGGHVDLTSSLPKPARYIRDVKCHARALQADGYLLKADADAIIQRAQWKFPPVGW